MGIFSTKKGLEREITNLKSERDDYRGQALGVDEKLNKVRLDKESNRLYYENRINEMRLSHGTELRTTRANHVHELTCLHEDYGNKINGLERNIEVLEENEKTAIEDGIVSEQNRLIKENQCRDKEHTVLLAKLEKEYAIKMAKMDKELEADKASYRKYLRTEMNSKIDTLEKENTRLVKENANLSADNRAINSIHEFAKGQVDATSNFANKALEALPTVTAEITTPEINVVGAPANANRNNGGEQKK